MRFGILSVVVFWYLSLAPVAAWSQFSPEQMKQMQDAMKKAQEMQQQAIQKAREAQEKARQAAEQQRQQQQQQQQSAQPGPAGMPNAAAAGSPPSAGPAQQLNAKVDQTLMGPWVSNNQMCPLVLSEDGSHIAITTAKGSRQVVLIDGVEGPLFDDVPKMIGGGQIAVRLSPSGGRSAYMGRRGADYIAVIDGKEVGKIMTQQNMNGMAGFGSGGFDFFFNQDGTHLVYPVVNDTGSLSMMIDGVKSQTWPAFDLKQTLVKGNRIAYVAQSNDKLFHFVVDGKPGPGYLQISSAMMTADGAHYAYIAQKQGSAALVLDGVEGKAYQSITNLDMAPDGRVAYTAGPLAPSQAPDSGAMLVLPGGQEVKNVRAFGVNSVSAAPFAPQRYVAFAPDGKGVAYVKANAPSPAVVAVVNGKASPEYSHIDNLQFSPDGKRYFFMASTGAGNFPVVDGQELPAVTGVTDFQFSPDSKRYAYKIWNASQGGGFSVMVDGKDSPHYRQDILGLRFSPDSRHVAYGALVGMNISADQAIIDGEVKPGYMVPWVNMNQTNPPVIFPPFFYSPDGNHLAYVGQKTDGTGKQAVVLDGVGHDGASQSFSFPAFSPDSRHFAWMNTTNKGWVVFLDQKMGPAFDTIIQNAAGARFTDNHTYRYYGIKDNQVYRVTIDLGS